MAKKRRSILGSIIGFILFLLIVYIVLAVLDFLGVFVMGTYKSGDVGLIEHELKFNGETDNEHLTWRAYGDEIYFYIDGEEAGKGKIQNGVITDAPILVSVAPLYKDGDKTREQDKKSFVDYLRVILKPATQLLGKLAE